MQPNLAIAAIALCVICHACSKDSYSYSDCVKDFIKQKNLAPRPRTGCDFFYAWYVYRGEDYFSLNCHCADMIITFQDCQGVTLEGERLRRFERDAKYKGIIGYVRW